ncbi:hypothetical protein KY348_00265 [Candidatus Woesearchaeota archaeon]|nr:hypothetical protein [Candidatus Woesearchaeota archaeon]
MKLDKKAFGKKANVLAAVLVIIVVVAGTVVFSNIVVKKYPTEDSQENFNTQADATLREAIFSGIADWLENGFSHRTPFWYNNEPRPVSFSEALDALYYYVNNSVSKNADLLTDDESDFYVAPGVRVVFDIHNSFDPESLDGSLEDFEVGIQKEDLEQLQDLSSEFSYPVKAGLFFTTFNTWMESNADNVTQNMFDKLLEKPCQLVTGVCLCDEPGAEFDPDAIDNIKLKYSDVQDVLDERVQALEDLFPADENIECGYIVEKLNINNHMYSDWSREEIGPERTIEVPVRVDPDPFGYVFNFLEWNETTTYPEEEDLTYFNLRPPLPVDTGIQGVYPGDAEVMKSCEEAIADIPEDPDKPVKVGMLAMNKKVALLAKIYCAHPEIKKYGETGFEPLTAEFRIRVSLALDCPLPSYDVDKHVGEPIYQEPFINCEIPPPPLPEPAEIPVPCMSPEDCPDPCEECNLATGRCVDIPNCCCGVIMPSGMKCCSCNNICSACCGRNCLPAGRVCCKGQVCASGQICCGGEFCSSSAACSAAVS